MGVIMVTVIWATVEPEEVVLGEGVYEIYLCTVTCELDGILEIPFANSLLRED